MENNENIKASFKGLVPFIVFILLYLGTGIFLNIKGVAVSYTHLEISGKEYNSCKKIMEILNRYQIATKEKFSDIDTSFLGEVIKKENSNINIAILTEYDALPEVGHACGHSASAAISILAALALKDNEEYINANICLLYTSHKSKKLIPHIKLKLD